MYDTKKKEKEIKKKEVEKRNENHVMYNEEILKVKIYSLASKKWRTKPPDGATCML